MNSMETRVGRMKARMVDWGKRLQQLAAKADAAESSASERHLRGIVEPTLTHEAARAELRDARKAGSKAWSVFKAKLDTACNELESTLDDLT